MAEHDNAEIIGVLNLYGFLLDAQQWDLFHRVFTADVKSEFGTAGLVWPDLASLKAHFVEFHEALDNHQHEIMGHVVHVDGDRAYAFSYGNWLLRREAVAGDPTWLGTGWYDDELVRTQAGWRIRSRVARMVSWSGNPAVSGHNPDADFALYVLKDEIEAGRVKFFNAIAGGQGGS
jgi:hypothetical protein